jgi:hypothetical protein
MVLFLFYFVLPCSKLKHMKKQLYSLILLLPLFVHAQNVGIGNPTPNEKLDVTGNINVTGTIKANGVDGNPNQVLMKNSTGNFSWGDVGNFKNIATFTDTLTANIVWNVPVNTTKIWVELWGGGGAGLDCGGGGGGYMSLLFDVVPAQTLQLTVGKGGKDAVTISSPTFKFNQSGSGSRIDIAGTAFIANAGNGSGTSTIFSFPQYFPGTGGAYFTFVPATTSPRGAFYTEAGQNGGGYKQTYEAVGTNQYFLHKLYGVGGAGANTAHYTAEPSIETFSVIISPASTTQTGHSVSRSGVFPSGGGAGGSGFVNDARSGANGLILIHY